MFRKIERFIFSPLLNALVICMFTIMAGAVFIQVIFRYVFHQPIYWSEELPRFMLIWLTFLGAVLATKNRSHLSITLIINRFSGTTKNVIQFLANLITLLFLFVVVWGGVVITHLTMPNRTAALQLPTGLFYLAAPVGTLMMIIYLIQQTVKLFRKSETPHNSEDPNK